MTLSKNDIQPLLAALLLYVITGPYFAWGLLKNNFFLAGANALLAFIFFKNNDIRKNQSFFILIFFIAILYSLNTGVSILGFINLAFSIFLAFGNEAISKKTFHYFLNIYSAIILASSIVWIGVLLGMVSPIGTITASNDLKTYDYTVYPLTLYANRLMFFRFCGPFDEPGVVGTFGAILLYLNGFKWRDWKTYALLLSGVLTLSLFFYVAVFLFFLIKNITSISIKHVAIFAIVLGAFYGLTKDNEIISERIWERLEWNEDEGKLAGDNRMVGDANDYYKKKKGTIEYWTGVRNIEKDLQYFEGSSSYKVVVLKCGMICFALYILFFLLYAHKYCNRQKFILFTVLFLTTIFQRPWMFGIGYFFLFPYFARFDYNDEYTRSRKLVIKRGKHSVVSATKQLS